MEEFILGVNYWASNAGADMWRNWDESVIENDLAILKKRGIKVLRVFPNWRDFQPVEPVMSAGHHLKEYRMTGDCYAGNPYFLDKVMLERFSVFCKIAEKQGLKLIVGLITGWMSGRLYIPPAIFERNIYTDPVALYFQQLFIKGFVEHVKDENAIYAWDLGNECNCMDEASNRMEAYSWSAMIVNAIKAVDHTRPIVSGMHSLELEGVWNIQDQGEVTDILTTHPYPFWVEHCHFEPLTSFRTLLHATAQTQYYATVGKKPCLVEELGSMGPMVLSEEKAADFLKVNLWSNWANGAAGVMWWCAHEQAELTAPPYDWNMCERELGMLNSKLEPKPVLLAMERFAKEQRQLNLELPYRERDAVCILSQGQNHWGIAYMSYILAKQAGLTMDFVYCEQELPESKLYFLPSAGVAVMSKKRYDLLKNAVYEGAVLYISEKDGIFTEFEELTGLKVEQTHRAESSGCVKWGDASFTYGKTYQVELKETHAKVLLRDQKEKPLFTVASYGKGKVYFLNFPLEENLLHDEKGFEQEYYQFYTMAAADILDKKGIQRTNPYVGMTLHRDKEEEYAVLVNYTEKKQNPGIVINKKQYKKTEILYGDLEAIEPFDACVLRLNQ